MRYFGSSVRKITSVLIKRGNGFSIIGVSTRLDLTAVRGHNEMKREEDGI